MTHDQFPQYAGVTWKRCQATATLEDLDRRVGDALALTRQMKPTEDAVIARMASLPHLLEYIVLAMRAVGDVNRGVAETTAETEVDPAAVREIREDLHQAAVNVQDATGHLLSGLDYHLMGACSHLVERIEIEHVEACDCLDAAHERVRGARGAWGRLNAGKS